MTLNAAKSSWRPAFAWVFVFGYSITWATLLGFLWMGWADFEVIDTTLNTLIGAGGLGATAYVGGRSYEKAMGKSQSEWEMTDELGSDHQPGAM